MGLLRRSAELLARAAATCALAYVVFDLLLGSVVLRALTAAAQGVLRLVERPAVLTSLASAHEHLVIASHLTGVERPLASWNAANLPIFLVATVGLALAAPARTWRRRLDTLLLALVVSVPTMLATTVIQIQVTGANAARAELGLRLLGERAESLLAAANQGIGIAMLLVPAAVFAVAYVRFRSDRQAATAVAPVGGAAGAAARGGTRGLVVVAAAEVVLLGTLAALGGATVDPRPGLVRVLERNPGAPRAYLALTSHDALVGLGKRAESPPRRARSLHAD